MIPRLRSLAAALAGLIGVGGTLTQTAAAPNPASPQSFDDQQVESQDQTIRFDIGNAVEDKSGSQSPSAPTKFFLSNISEASNGEFSIFFAQKVYSGKLFASPDAPATPDAPFFVGKLLQFPDGNWHFRGQWTSNQPIPSTTGALWSFAGRLTGAEVTPCIWGT